MHLSKELTSTKWGLILKITLALQKSIPVKKIQTKFISMKNSILKGETLVEYENYKNLLSTPMKKNEHAFHSNEEK